MSDPGNALWAKLEAEGRLVQQTWYFGRGAEPICEYDMFTLRLTSEERERLLYPSVMHITNTAILGES